MNQDKTFDEVEVLQDQSQAETHFLSLKLENLEVLGFRTESWTESLVQWQNAQNPRRFEIRPSNFDALKCEQTVDEDFAGCLRPRCSE